jgi:ribosomal-protein-alanine N-acetyltransferase
MPEIATARFILRDLRQEDITNRYLEWFLDPAAQRHITAAAHTQTLAQLRDYLAERTGRRDVLFLGIFDRTTGVHIGNVKYEPVDAENGYAVMGILIGDAAYRGQGVAGEVIVASSRWLQANGGIREILLGVHRDNAAAIHAYERVGFVIEQTPFIPPTDDAFTMVWRLEAESV